jgi:VRR-NUC domain
MIAFHPRNEGRDQRTLAGINSGLGVVSGMPDVFIVKGGAAYAIELKTENGRLTDAQAEVLSALRAAGAYVVASVWRGGQARARFSALAEGPVSRAEKRITGPLPRRATTAGRRLLLQRRGNKRPRREKPRSAAGTRGGGSVSLARAA